MSDANIRRVVEEIDGIVKGAEGQCAHPYAGIMCRVHGAVDIDRAEYDRQMAMPNALWTCPKCGHWASFDDKRFEELNPPPDET